MTLGIAICDDDKNCRDRLYDILLDYSVAHDIDMTVDCYPDGRSLVNACHNPGQYNILFMDIEMPGISGIDAAVSLRNSVDKNLETVFISSYNEYMGDSFAAHPYQFIQKPFADRDIYDVMDELTSDMCSNVSFISIRDNTGSEYTINSDDICYIESTDARNRDITYHLVDRDIMTRGTLSEVEKKIGETRFVRCSRTAIVNLAHIYYIKDMTIYFDNHMSVTVSRRCRNMLEEQYIQKIVSGKRG